MHRRLTLALFAMSGLVVVAGMCACGKPTPAPQSSSLLRIQLASDSVRNAAVVAFLRPSASSAQIANLRTNLPYRDGVTSWAECGSTQAMRLDIAIFEKGLPGGEGATEAPYLKSSLSADRKRAPSSRSRQTTGGRTV